MKQSAAGSLAVLALGSNLPSRPRWLDVARAAIEGAGIEVLATTPRWNTVPIGTVSQPDYLNQLLLVAGRRRGAEWLELVRAVEARAGRRRGLPKGPRTLDLDIILIQDESWATAELQVPHPGLLNRPYLLRGSALLVPDWIHPEEGLSMTELAWRGLTGCWALGDPAVGSSG
ncbi:MAG TPA: 2-amino-4-hydroxy-6-hydroxymethyldihydropteridine diphosphokinase [Candidatus Micrarchaeaceae archaeon]|nr:2-amino-4-hydroxy-6-hydroxymethyldihydropteridine diphosphokinase [Candidatus Micrarchaeaceae archaeon]